MQIVFHHSQQLARGIYAFWFMPEHPYRFIAGQYAQLRVPHMADSRGDTRWLTLFNAPSEPLLSFTVKIPPRHSSYKRALLALRPGDTATLSEAIGDFVAPKDRTIPIVFVVGGIGIAPVRSIVADLHQRRDKRPLTLLYFVGSRAELLQEPLFSDYGLIYKPIITKQEGRLTPQEVLQLVGDPAGKLLFISGPQPLAEPLWHDLQTQGVSRDQLVLDYFPGYS
ncbi:MAG TPA: FAD-dependent oxidoreductase [Nevskiaceae bacterium]|nr:FAD-dependent oxidoreductase [Nevskiaceae bacterium]